MQAARLCRNCDKPVNWVKVRPMNAKRNVFSCIFCGGATARIKKQRTKKAKKSSLPKLKQLDDLAREACRQRGSCEAAGLDSIRCGGSLQWAHILSRNYHKVRWDSDNCLYLCAAHHTFYTYRPVHWRWFLIMKIGEPKLLDLERRSMSTGKVDRIAILEKLKNAVHKDPRDV